MRLYKLISFFLLVWFCQSAAVAKEITVAVNLVDIKTEKPSEARGDEIYFHLTKYSSLGTSKEERLPVFPLHWLSKQTNSIKNVVLWQGLLQEGESVKLIISLLEEDLPPWDADELLGSAQLTLTNKSGKLTKEWTIPVFEETQEVEMLKVAEPQRYVFKGDNAIYDVAFHIDQKS
jgi:hypothetical protein